MNEFHKHKNEQGVSQKKIHTLNPIYINGKT